MLIKFVCQNIYSINDEIEFRMFKSPTRVLKDHVYNSNNKIKILKSAIMYGANAAGKTNFVKAINIGRSFIFGGPNNPNRIDIPTFKLESDENKNSLFEFTFLSNGTCYIYGYELNQKSVVKEWCYKLISKKPKLLFERETLKDSTISLTKGDFAETKKEENFFAFCQDATRPTQLFLTTLINNNTKHFGDIISWFKKLTIIYPESKFGNLFTIIADNNFYQSFIEILNDLGIDIDDFDTKKGSIDDKWLDVPQNIIDDVKKKITPKSSIHLLSSTGQYLIFSMTDDNKIEVTKLYTQHLNFNNEKINFEIFEESDGTRRLFDLIPMLLNFKKSDSVFIVDELDRSFHTNLSKSIFKLFHKYTNDRPCQLIATTHDTNLMDLSIFRNDEIWYAKKNSFKSTELYSLYEFKQRYDKNLVKDYLNGRFGAVPEINIIEG